MIEKNRRTVIKKNQKNKEGQVMRPFRFFFNFLLGIC